jgi:MFS family permease
MWKTPRIWTLLSIIIIIVGIIVVFSIRALNPTTTTQTTSLNPYISTSIQLIGGAALLINAAILTATMFSGRGNIGAYKYRFIISGVIIGIFILTIISISPLYQTTIQSNSLLVPVLSILLIYITTIIVAVMGYQKGKKQYQQQQKDLKNANEQILQSFTGIDNIDISKGIQLQLNQQEGYYIFAKRQAVVSSIISITIIIAGVLLGMVCIATAFFLKSNIPLAYITGALSAITELIGGLVFVFNTQASKKMDKYFDSLEALRNRMVSIQLLDKYPDEQEMQKN